METEIKEIKKQLKTSGDIILKEELKGMKRVLRRYEKERERERERERDRQRRG